MSRIKLLLTIIAAVIVCLASVFMFLPDLFKSALDVAAIEFTLFSNLFKLAVNLVTSMFTSLWFATLMLKAAAGLTVGFTALIAILVKRSSFTKIAFRNIPRRKLRNGLTMLAIILGVALVVCVNIAFDSAFAEFKHTVNQATGNVDINIRSGLDEPFDQNLLSTVKEVDGVADASGRVSGQVVVLRPDGGWELATVIGVDSSFDFSYLDPDIRITRKLPFIKFPIQLKVNGTDAVVDEGLNYTIGDLITVYAITNLNLTNQLNQTEQVDLTKLFFFTVVGVYHPKYISTEQYGRHTIYIDLVKAQEIFDCKGKLNNIIVKVTDIKQTDHVVSNMRSKLDATYIITPIKKNILTGMGEAFSGFQYGLQIMSALALCVAIIIILNTIYMNVGERTFEIGILRSVGSFRRQIFWMFFSESLTLGLIGVVVGLAMGIPLARAFITLSSYLNLTLMPPVTTPVVTPWHFVLGAITGLITAVAGGIFPSMLACRMDVVKTLRPAMRMAGKPRTALKLTIVGLLLTVIGALAYMGLADVLAYMGLADVLVVAPLILPFLMAGLILLVAGLLRSASPVIEGVLIPFGKIRKIISRNIERNLVRSTICFTLIGMTLSFVVVIAGAQAGVVMGVENVIHSFYSADLTVSSHTLLPRSFADDLNGVDDSTLISRVAPALIVPRRVLLVNNVSNPEMKSTSMVLSIDPTLHSQVMPMTFGDETPTDVFAKLDTPETIILTSPLAKTLNVTVGSVVEMQTISDDGSPTSMNFKVIGIAVGAFLEWEHGEIYSSPLSEASYISYKSLNISFPTYGDMANLFFVKVKSNQNVGHVKDRIVELYGGKHKLSIMTVNDALEPARTGINNVFIILNAVVMFAMVNAAIGVAAIMIMNIAERRREIGIMRSQGMSKFQVVAFIIGEVMVLATVGFAVGTIAGLIIHRVTISYMRSAGFPMPYIIPFDAIGLSLALAVLTSIVSVAYPAYHASKLNIVEALRRLE